MLLLQHLLVQWQTLVVQRVAELFGLGPQIRFVVGIGGVLDLLDSLLFTAPIVYLFLRMRT